MTQAHLSIDLISSISDRQPEIKHHISTHDDNNNNKTKDLNESEIEVNCGYDQ